MYLAHTITDRNEEVTYRYSTNFILSFYSTGL